MINKKLYGVWALLLCSALQPLQAATEEVVNTDGMTNYLSDVLLATGAFVFFAGLLALWGLYRAVMETARIRLLQEMGIEAMEKAGLTVSGEPWWKQQYKKWTNVVPIEKEQDVMLDHDYDGIRELDNSLPPWWVAMFYITIGVGVVYYGYYHIMDYGPLSAQAYEIEMEEAEEAVKAYLAKQANAVDETNAEMLEDATELSLGETTFNTYCATCHGMLGEGGVGPNLTDPYWIHGGDIKDVFKTVKYGVPEKGMIAWQSQLRPADIHRVSSYIMTLVGTDPPNPKEPQGDLYQSDTPTATDSLATDQALGLAN